MEIQTRENIVVPPDELQNEVEHQEDKLNETLETSAENADDLEEELGDDVPSRFQKMTKKQIIDSYLNAEQEKSRLGNEVGSLRKSEEQLKSTIDEYISNTKEKSEPITSENLLDNPDETLRSYIQNDPYVKSLEQRVNELSQGSIQSKFDQRHPDADKVVNSPEFAQYVQSNPAVSILAAEASSQQDLNKLAAVLDQYKIVRGQSSQQQANQQREDQLNDAQLEKGRGGVRKKPGITKAEIDRVRNTDQELYWSPPFQKKVLDWHRNQRK